MAEAYSDYGRTSYKYQYSVGVALHGTDVSAYFAAPTVNHGPDFAVAFKKIFGNFIVLNDPSITNEVANGPSSNMSSASSPASSWPLSSINAPYQINLNQTGGELVPVPVTVTINLTEAVGPGLRNNFTLVNAYTWEGGRGYRYDFWRSMAALVPE
jgi:hypothetical protein